MEPHEGPANGRSRTFFFLPYRYPPATEGSGMNEQVHAILDHARQGRAAEAVDVLLGLKPREMVEATRAATVHLVTADQNPAAAILVGWAGAMRVHALAREAPEIHNLAAEFAEHARSLFFTLGSLLWPGWGVAGLHLDATATAVGRACADRARVLADQMDAPAMLASRSHWLAGVHAMAAGETSTARGELADAARRAEEAGAQVEVRLLRAYLLMAQALGQPNDPEIPYELSRVCREFETQDGTASLGQQLRVAWAALAPERPLPEPVRIASRDREAAADG